MQNPFDPGYFESHELRAMGFGAVGDNVRIARNCTIVGLPDIFIGNHVRIDGYTTIIAAGGKVTFGNYIHIGGSCHFAAAADLTFGDFSGTSQGVRIYTANDDYSGKALAGPMVPPECRDVDKGPVTLGRYAVIGSGSVVLPRVTIAEGSVVGALSLVTTPLDPWGVYFGCPVRRLKARSKNLQSVEAMILADSLHEVV